MMMIHITSIVNGQLTIASRLMFNRKIYKVTIFMQVPFIINVNIAITKVDVKCIF